MVEVPVNITIGAVDPAGRVGRNRSLPTAADLAAALPAEAWRRQAVRPGAQGPLVFEFAAVRVGVVRHRRPGPPIWQNAPA